MKQLILMMPMQLYHRQCWIKYVTNVLQVDSQSYDENIQHEQKTSVSSMAAAVEFISIVEENCQV